MLMGPENVDPYSTIIQNKTSRHRYVLDAYRDDLFCVWASCPVSLNNVNHLNLH